MATASRTPFKLRAFGSILLLLSLLVMVATGLVLYYEPRGFVSPKWGDAHAVFGFLLILAAVIHLIYNGRTLLGYLKAATRETRFARTEGIAALLVALALLFGSTVGLSVFRQKSAYAEKDVILPVPQIAGGIPLMQSLSQRKSIRNYVDAPLTPQQLSNILWAANGTNRSDGKSRTAPTSYGVNFVEVYVVTADGICLYNPRKHALELVVAGDYRDTTTIGQPFVKVAAVNLVYVADPSAWSTSVHKPDDREQMLAWANFAAGAMAQNVGLVAASEGLGNVVRSSIPHDVFAKAARLPEGEIVLVAQTVGVMTK